MLSVVPPGAAVEVAEAIASAAGDARPLVADLNAVAPTTVRRVADLLAEHGDRDRRRIDLRPTSDPCGNDPHVPLGPRAADIASLPVEGVELILVGDTIGLASAVKMCTASVYKGRVALLAQALRTAAAFGVVEHVLDDLAGTGIADRERTGATLGKASAKAWRYVAEMEEIAATQADAGLTPELFRAVARIYADLAERGMADAPENVPDDIALDEVLRRLNRGTTPDDP